MVNGKSGPLTEGCFYFGNHHKQLVNFEEDLQLHFDIFRILGLENVEKEKCCIRLICFSPFLEAL